MGEEPENGEMTMTTRIWILGAPDPELAMIESLLRDAGEHVEYAFVDGRRVRPDEAYRANCEAARGFSGTAYEVECAIDVLHGSATEGIDSDASVVTIDHHRPGDPGFGRPPSEFLMASSIGQVVAELARLHRLDVRRWPYGRVDSATSTIGAIAVTGIGANHPNLALRAWTVTSGDELAPVDASIPTAIVFCAAADHCLGAAYRGECPGVDPDALMRWRAESRAAFQRRSVAEVMADVEQARSALREAHEISLLSVADMPHTEDHDWSRSVCDGCLSGEEFARDMRGQHVPELPEASAREGLCFVSDGLPGPNGRTKIVCQSGTPEQIEAFMHSWAPANGLADIYGDPARGFAGGYR